MKSEITQIMYPNFGKNSMKFVWFALSMIWKPLVGSIIAVTARASSNEPINIPVPVSRFFFLQVKMANK